MPLTEIPTFPPELRRGTPLIIFLALGVLCGAIGAGLLLWFAPSLRRAEIPAGTQSVIVSSPGTVIVEEGTRISDILKQSKDITAAVYNPKSVIHTGDNTYYPQTLSKGGAISLTTDGWFASVSDVAPAVGDIITVRGDSYPIAKIVKDSASPFILMKVVEGTFASARLMSGGSYETGMTVVATSPAGDAVRMNLITLNQNLNSKDGITKSSDELTNVLGVTQTAEVMPGSPVFGLNGEVIGLVYKSENNMVVLPSDSLRGLVDRVLRYGEANRASLGLYYVVFSNDNDQTRQAFVYPEKGTPVVPGSPAAKARFQSGDIILSIDQKNVSESSDIFGIISSHVPGDEISIKYSRGAETYTKSVELSSLSPGG